MNTTDQPTPEPGYRMLDVGEVIQEGDEWFSEVLQRWEKCIAMRGYRLADYFTLKYSRRLPSQPETPSGPAIFHAYALPPKDEAQETPRTDAAIKVIDVAFVGHEGLSSSPEEYVEPDFARTLERELIAAQRALAAAEGERDKARMLAGYKGGNWALREQLAAGSKARQETLQLFSEVVAERDRLRAQRDAALAELQALKEKGNPSK